ncbi:hypothetical protein K493DRAFT_205184 [Basidiobolus meristosporus CBS 931.73]|uniref:Citrate transporter-like domain-containing protein n=1 Tax=Basidiobolus meristosporus CBS 931.73 TaxID=1314790 RepID=A0A1Y1Z3S7_9FUNG|nr:hypothetical protein K493DRAFT_205184 [Basidiobolus meristosporus CBS 931.73]|eukprot:ORY04912.1 hypothetical protein K493DRAFT_205184 [Basidiobolus meristosporus CBS 931.73]
MPSYDGRAFATIFYDGNIDGAELELKSYSRRQFAWKRNVFRRVLVGMERKVEAAGMLQESTQEIVGRSWEGMISPLLIPASLLGILACLVVLVILVYAKIFDTSEQQNCFAMLVFVSLAWATEVIPLFVTALLVPMMAVFLRVLRSDDGLFNRLTAQQASQRILASMFAPVIMLLLGSFSITTALGKYNVADIMTTWAFSKIGTRFSTVLLICMTVATLASIWVGNVVGPVLCFSLIQPILRTLPPNSPFARCLIMGITFASNIGGMASLTSSLENTTAIDIIQPRSSWTQWYSITLPICVVSDLAVWRLLLWNCKPASHIPNYLTTNDRKAFSRKQLFIIFVTLLTLIFLCVESQLASMVGDPGVIAIIPMIVFFGSGLLIKEDFNNFLWTVVILAMGGITLGEAVESSGLLHAVAQYLCAVIEDLSPWNALVITCSAILVMSTFFSHSVGALVILPLVTNMKNTLPSAHLRLLTMSATLMCSGAMGLPISGFSNMIAAMHESEVGVRYLSNKDFLKNGIPASCLVLLIIVTIGYGLYLTIGH